MTSAAQRIATFAEKTLHGPLPLRVRAWDGSEAGPTRTPALLVRHPNALRRLLWRPGELGLARAWVAGELDVEGDLYQALSLLAGQLWDRDPGSPGGLALARDPQVRAAARDLLALTGPWPPPPPPREEVRRRWGLRHSLLRDRRAISHHYDVGNAFYELVLGPSMVYSCAYWGDDVRPEAPETPETSETPDAPGTADRPEDVLGADPTSTPRPPAAGGEAGAAAGVRGLPVGRDLESAQRAKLELVCRKLALRPGSRLLDVGCGWGSMVLHAAREHGVRAVGITLSREQAGYARKRIAEAGLSDRVEIRVQDYRETDDGPYDAISSIGMAEHVGAAGYRRYAERLHHLLRDGGRLLNHQIARPPQQNESAYRIDPFIDAYVFPDGELAPVARTVGALEEVGFEVRDVESLREHYALTLRRWVANLERHWKRAVRLSSPGRARVWRLYMAASALAFERGRIGVNQTLAVRTPPSGAAGLGLRPRRGWTG